MHHNEIAQFRSNALGPGLGCTEIGGGQDHHELFSAIAADKILSTNASNQERTGFAENSIARVVTVSVIEPLEVVEIEHQEA